MGIDNPSILDENAPALLASVDSVNLNQAADTEIDLHTTPASKKFIPLFVVLHTFSAGVSNAVATLGKKGGSCDEFLGNQTLTNISAAGDYVILMPIPSATPAKLVEFAAGEVLALEITTTEGSALTCTADVYGRHKNT